MYSYRYYDDDIILGISDLIENFECDKKDLKLLINKLPEDDRVFRNYDSDDICSLGILSKITNLILNQILLKNNFYDTFDNIPVTSINDLKNYFTPNEKKFFMNKDNKHRLQEIIDYHNERLNEKTIHIKPRKIPTELHGLKNFGNTCFLNSALQLLKSHPFLDESEFTF